MRQKIEIALIALFLAALVFSLGFFFGRSSVQAVSVSLDRAAQTEAPQTEPPTEALRTLVPTETDMPETEAVPETEAISYPLDLNAASAEELETLPGIGPTLAGRIVDYREANGPFRTLADLTKVRGIGEKTLAAIMDYLKVEEP